MTQPHLITHVETTPSTIQEVEVIDKIHADLAEEGLLPREHLVDMGNVSMDALLGVGMTFKSNWSAKFVPDNSWQALANEGFDLTHFEVTGTKHQVTCPAGQHSSFWKPSQLPSGKQTVPSGVCQEHL